VHGGQAYYAYSTNYLIDLDHAVIMDVEPSTAIRQAEVTACKRMIERVQDRFGVWPERLAADTGYGSAEMLAWLVHERDIHPHRFTAPNSGEARQKFAERKIAMRAFGQPEDVANAVTVLASPRARYITGTVLLVDGCMRRYLF